MGMTGGKYPRLVDQKTVLMDMTATNESKKQIQLKPVRNFVILIFIDEMPSPDPNSYIVLQYEGTSWGSSVTSILRPNGTYGTDSTIASFNYNNGILTLGGQYGYFPEGKTYHVYLFEVGRES